MCARHAQAKRPRRRIEIARNPPDLGATTAHRPGGADLDWFDAETETNAAQPPSSGTRRLRTEERACCDSSKVTDEGAAARSDTALLPDADGLGRRADASPPLARSLPAGAAHVRYGGEDHGCTSAERSCCRSPRRQRPSPAFTPAYPPLNPRLLDLYSLSATGWD